MAADDERNEGAQTRGATSITRNPDCIVCLRQTLNADHGACRTSRAVAIGLNMRENLWATGSLCMLQRSGRILTSSRRFPKASLARSAAMTKLEMPPWPEAQIVSTVGRIIEHDYHIPFYFPSPDYPEDDCPRWWQRHHGTPCQHCGILLLQDREPCPWRGMCYHCYLALESQW
jgi:hypothetical protein